jgi:hypothetical protein
MPSINVVNLFDYKASGPACQWERTVDFGARKLGCCLRDSPHGGAWAFVGWGHGRHDDDFGTSSSPLPGDGRAGTLPGPQGGDCTLVETGDLVLPASRSRVVVGRPRAV